MHLTLRPATLLRMQFEGQKQSYTQRYPHGERLVILFEGVQAGQLWTAQARVRELPKRLRQGTGP